MTRRPGPAAPPLLVSVLVTLLVTACSAGTEPGEPVAEPEASSSSEEPALSAPELDGADGGAGGPGAGSGGAPAFEGRRPLTIRAARRTAVDEPCTANQIERLCGSSAVFEVRLVGPPRSLTLLSATTRPDPAGLTWQVRLEFAPDGAPLPLPTPRDDQVLTDDAGRQVVVTPAARVSGREIVLPGYPKREAWLTVEQLAGEA